MNKKLPALILICALLLSLCACGGSSAKKEMEKEALEKITSSEDMELEEAQEIISALDKGSEELEEMRLLLADLALCEGFYIQEKEEDDYKTYTANVRYRLINGVPHCTIIYTGYMRELLGPPAKVERTGEDGYLFYPEPSDGFQTFQIHLSAEQMHIVWGDGICDYMLHKWSGDPAELEDLPYEESEDYQFVVGVIDSVLDSIDHRYRFDQESKTLSVIMVKQYGMRAAILADIESVADTLNKLAESLEPLSERMRDYMNIELQDYFDIVPEAHCEFLFVDHLKEGDVYETEDIIFKVRDGKTVINIADGSA